MYANPWPQAEREWRESMTPGLDERPRRMPPVCATCGRSMEARDLCAACGDEVSEAA